ncbi:hypothetical protein RND81_08G058600, partial [Saponaria officinalis]
MTCSICKSKTHNKRKCPDKDKVGDAPAKRGRGRPRLSGVAEPPVSSTAVAAASLQSDAHHDITAQPTRVGRGGRVIRSGRGAARGGGRGGGRGGRRGGRRGAATAPVGMGVLFDEQGNVFTNDQGSGPRSMVSAEAPPLTNVSTQAS